MSTKTAQQPSPGQPLIELRQVVKRYEGQAGAVTALKGIDLLVDRGELLVITGKSGAGKTTLVNVLTGLDRLTSGQVWVAGTLFLLARMVRVMWILV